MIALITQGLGALTPVTQGYGGIAVAPPPPPVVGGGGLPIAAIVYSEDHPAGRKKPEIIKVRRVRPCRREWEELLVINDFDFVQTEIELELQGCKKR